MSTICKNKTLCVVVSVWNKCTMAQNSVAKMVNEASDVRGAAGGTEGVAGGSVEMPSGIGCTVGTSDVAGTSGTDFVRSLSYCSYSTCAGTIDVGLGGTAIGVE